MAALPNSKTVTCEEWLRKSEASDAIEEVVNGEIRISPPPKWKHSEIVNNVFRLISAQVDWRQITVKISQFGLIVRRLPLATQAPDLAVSQANTIAGQDGYIHSAPQLIVAVLSPANNRREREEKLADYASLGVPEVWVVLPQALTVEVLVLANGFLRRAALLAEGTLTPTQFPGVEITIASIWPD